jgi:hypothetical protein
MIHPTTTSAGGDTLFFAVHYPPNSSKPQLISLSSPPVTASCGDFNTSLTSTVVDLSSVIASDEPLDLSTPTRENITLESSLKDEGIATEVIDPNVAVATLSAVSSGTITPLIKEELRCTIQQKRLSSGKEELTVDVNEQKHCEV